MHFHKSTMRVKTNKKLVTKGRRTSHNLDKVHVCIVQGEAGERQDTKTCTVEAAESKESGAGSCECVKKKTKFNIHRCLREDDIFAKVECYFCVKYVYRLQLDLDYVVRLDV